MSTAGWFAQNSPSGAPPPSAPPVAKTPAAPANTTSWFAQNGPGAAAPTAPATPSAAEAPSTSGKSEGVYQMKSPDGRQVQIPYSGVKTAGPNGYRFVNQGELARYAKDHAADPIDEGAVDKYLDKVPWWDMPGHALNLLSGVGTGIEKTAAGLDRAVRGSGPLTGPEEQLQLDAARPTQGLQTAGEFGENVGEFFSGEELLGLVGKGLQGAEKLKAATQAAQLLEKHPMIAKLVKIGQNAVRQGGIAGAQTFAKTGGDTGAAAKTAIETGAAGGAIEGLGAAAKAGVSALTPKVETGAADYAAEARNAVKPHLEAAAAAVKPPTFDVDAALNKVHDFTGASDQLGAANNAVYEHLDKATGGTFRTLNKEVQAAQKAAAYGDNDAKGAYIEKLNEMEDLLSRHDTGMSPEDLAKVKSSWTQSYILKDFGNAWDKALNGVPGGSNVSQEQRGINGDVLMNGLRRAVADHGRPKVEAALGQGRLDNLENIARLNRTNAQRATFNRGIGEVAKYLGPAYIGGRIGYHAAGLPGELAGNAIGAAAKPAAEKVMNAVKANPKIGQYLTYAIDSGADPKKFGPLLATMIQQSNTEASEQQQEEEGNQ
jgi:hypothetical protein